MRKLTRKRLRTLLHYNARTGEWTRRTSIAQHKAGQRAGYLHYRGYRRIGVDGQYFAEHILAWFYMTGRWPKKDIDHKNNKVGDNKWNNLRAATKSQNAGNGKLRITNKTGFKGVSIYKQTGKYRARIYCGRASVSLGLFSNPKLAHMAYCKAARRIFGKFARAA